MWCCHTHAPTLTHTTRAQLYGVGAGPGNSSERTWRSCVPEAGLATLGYNLARVECTVPVATLAASRLSRLAEVKLLSSLVLFPSPPHLPLLLFCCPPLPALSLPLISSSPSHLLLSCTILHLLTSFSLPYSLSHVPSSTTLPHLRPFFLA